MAALMGVIIGAIIAAIIVLLASLLGELLSPVVLTVLVPALAVLIILGHAAVGFVAGLGLFRGTSLGRFLYYSSSTSFFRGLVGQIVFTLLGIGFFNIFR
jgi:mannose/fructose/N-acetylgalactosamine-specific phosphotransferase system component IID